ncbi:twin-arginine translocation signal domain-containing protein [Natrarchaeobius sp. A-rgal3]|uniref:twin-arginine translocation signal domain-containing protein n=1 Tax=Natrarchaeobius versutus TaxID=1679078 RepID=UPI00350EFD84
MDSNTRQTRRRLLGTAAAAVSTMALAGCGGPGEEEDEADPDEPAGEEEPGEEAPDENGPDAEEGTGNGQEMDDEDEPGGG